MTEKRRILTGITTSGTPHLGNYVGAIRPAIAASRRADAESFYFLADYHALVKTGDPARVHFGVPTDATLDKLIVRWPDGATSAIDSIRPNTILKVTR